MYDQRDCKPVFFNILGGQIQIFKKTKNQRQEYHKFIFLKKIVSNGNEAQFCVVKQLQTKLKKNWYFVKLG